jgi:peptidoglycan/LPS O-acetylase OafA/YrhL
MIRDKRTADVQVQHSVNEAGTAPEDRRFRPDVQGLRAVAVVLVVLFHAHVPGFGGGYVGVDVFFVISGFVITGVLLRERSTTGSTSILSFYGRRARRILPAATVVIIATVVASFPLLGPLSGEQTAKDSLWASVFLINLHFAATGTNYLASQLPPSLLQNFWSLAVEEQFYLVYPAIIIAVASLSWRLSFRRRLGIVLGAAALGSLVVSIVQTSTSPTAAYFSPLPRVWELSLGGIVALSTEYLRRWPAPISAVLSWLGLASILGAGAFYSSSTAYPGWAVALPVLGAALIIAGGAAAPERGAEWLLRMRPFQWIGLISYSLYLWHWPVLTLVAERRGTGSLPVSESLLWLLVSLGLSIATYRLVENPIRRSPSLIGRRWASVVLGGCLILASLTVATAEIHLHRVPGLATDLTGLQTSAACPSPTAQELIPLMGTSRPASQPPVSRLMVVGDSTACTMLPGLEAVGAPLGIQVENAAVIGCGVVSGQVAPIMAKAPSRLCAAKAAAAEARALRLGQPDVVLWASSWEREPIVVGSGSHQRVLAQGSAPWYTVLLQRMTQRIRQFEATGATVVLLTQPPFAESRPAAGPTSADRDFERLNQLEAQVAARMPHVKLVDLATRVCPSGPPCPLVVDNVFARGDGAHYTAEGSLWVARWLLPRLGIKELSEQSNPLPVMKLVVPPNGSAVRGPQLVDATSSFPFDVSRVDFRLNGPKLHKKLIGTVAVERQYGWYFIWETTSVPDGTYTLQSIAYGPSGNHSASAPLRVRVAN